MASTQLPPARVLIVEDGAENRELITLVLQQAGLQIVTAENGKEGVDAALAGDFDAIMMDMQMPVMDGYQAARLLRQRGVQLPIVALTAHAMKGDEQKCLDAGCSDFLTKPINIDLLMQKLQEVFQRQPPRPRSVPPATAFRSSEPATVRDDVATTQTQVPRQTSVSHAPLISQLPM
ncbi:MAG: response regulator, partial [Planctomycetaceae bacterium]|nr:response regulator [Planctomycetaceae bacterium]